jgi:oligopeptidase B
VVLPRYETGQDYPVQARRKDGPGVDALSIQQANAAGDFATEQVLLDVNAMAAGKGFFGVGRWRSARTTGCWPGRG